jgi:hypothetical protein
MWLGNHRAKSGKAVRRAKPARITIIKGITPA